MADPVTFDLRAFDDRPPDEVAKGQGRRIRVDDPDDPPAASAAEVAPTRWRVAEALKVLRDR